MNRTFLLLAGLALACGAVAAAEEATVPATPVADAEKAPAAVADAPAVVWPVAPKPGPLLAKVVYVNDRVVEKCWVKVLNEGAWVVVDDTYCWYLRSAFKEVKFLDEEPTEALKKSLEVAEAKRKAELERQRKADEARAKAEAEAAGEGKPGEQAAAGGGPTAGQNTPANSALPGTPGLSGGGSELAGIDKRRATGGGGGGGGGWGPDRRYVHVVDGQLAVQWRVREIDRERGTVLVRNRATKELITLEVANKEDLAHIKGGDILTGTLTPNDPKLKAEDGTTIEFEPIATPPYQPLIEHLAPRKDQ